MKALESSESSTADNPPLNSPSSAPAPVPEGQSAKTVEQLQAELAAANAKIAELSATEADASAIEKLVSVKMKSGITRAQAESVVRRQIAFDDSDYGKMCAARHRNRQSGTLRQ
jgi:hypothetical protein